MKRTLAILLILCLIVLGIAGCFGEKTKNQIISSQATGVSKSVLFDENDLNSELSLELAEKLTSLGIVGYEIMLSDSNMDHEYEDGERDYVFDYIIQTDEVELIARGRGSISGNKARLNSGLAYIVRSEDDKFVWTSTPGFEVYDWQTGELKE